MKKWFLILSIAFLIFNINPAIGDACSCHEHPPIQKDFDRQSAIFSGKVREISIENDSYPLISTLDPVQVTFEVSEVWKGEVGQEVIIHTVRDSTSCGYVFSMDTDYLVFASGTPDQLQTGLCDRTKLLDSATEELAFLREGKTPAELPVEEVKETRGDTFPLNTSQVLMIPVVVLLLLAVCKKWGKR